MSQAGFDFSGLTPVGPPPDVEGFDFSDLAPSDPRSKFAKAVDIATTPLVPQLASGAKDIADRLDRPREITGGFLDALAGLPDVMRGLAQDPAEVLKAGVAGAIEGAGQVASSFTSPLDALLTATGLRGVRTASGAVGQAARGITRLGSAALAGRGAERAIDADSASEAAAGVFQAALGAAGAAPGPSARKPAEAPVAIRGLLRSAPITVAPDGTAALPGQTIPMSRTPDGSYVRTERGEFARREPRALLPERAASAQEFIATPDGQVQPRGAQVASRLDDFSFEGLARASGATTRRAGPDPSFVRAEPAALPRRDPVALLPERAASAAEWVSTPRGTTQRRGDIGIEGLADDVGPLPEVPPKAEPDPSFVRAERGTFARIERPWDELTTEQKRARLDTDQAEWQELIAAHRAESEAVSTAREQALAAMRFPTMSAETQRELRRIYAEMDALPYVPRTFNDVPGQGSTPEIAAGAGGAKVYHDIMQGRSGTRGQVLAALKKFIDGGGKPTAIVRRAIDVAERRLAGDRTLAKPQLPPDAGDVLDFHGAADSDVEFPFGANIGDEGRAGPQLLAHLAGGATGAAAGASSGEEDASTGERVLRGVLGGLVGAAVPALASGQRLTLRGHHVSGPSDPTSPGTLVGTLRMAGGLRESASSVARPHADPLAGTEVFVRKFPDALRAGIRDVLEQNQGFDAQRRGVLARTDVVRLAEGIQADVSARLKPGTALNAEGIRRFSDGIATAQAKVDELTAKVVAGGATDADVVALESAKAEVATLTASVMGARAEAGRALAEFKVLARVLRSRDPRVIREAADGLRPQQAEFAANFRQLPPDPLARYRWLHAQRAPTVMDRARSYYYANILSGLKTHERNAIGNAANVASHLLVHPVSASLDAVRSKITGQPRELHFSELPSQVAGVLVGVPRGLSDALFALRHGVTRGGLSGAMTAADAGKLDLPRVEFSGGGLNPFNYPGRALDASDQFFRAIARDMELYGAAHAQAKREGLRGADLENRMAELVTGTDEAAQAVQSKADAFARRTVFQEKPGALAAWLQGVTRQYPVLSFFIPFVKTPANIVRQGLEFSPVGFGMAGVKQGGRAGAQAQGRAAAGSFALGGLAYLASTGQLTGSGPSDPVERAQLMESGWRPNSIRIGDQYVSYSLFQPISVPAAIVANGFEAWRDQGEEPDDAGDVASDTMAAAWQAMAKSGRSLLDQSFLSGVSDLFQLLQESDRPSADRTLGRLAHSMTPFAGAQRTVKEALDPAVRAPEGIMEHVKASTPGLSGEVPARLDRFGRDVTREGGPLQRAADPFNRSTATDDPVLQELGRLGVRMGFPSGDGAGVNATRDVRRAMQQGKGQTTYAVLARLMGSDRYRTMSDAEKSVVIDAVIERTRNRASKVLRGRLIESEL